MIEVRAYEGLIRNYRDLAKELRLDLSDCTRKDREKRLMVAAFQTWGNQMGAHINGQFACALYDTEKQEMFCTRDVLGAELLFYYETADGRLLVGTNIADLFDQEGFVCSFNRELLQFYLGFTYVPGEDTLFSGVHKLEPGGWLRFSRHGLKRGRYWTLKFEPYETKSLETWADEIEEAFEKSLHDVCDGEKNVDSFLSGGVDSSYIMAKSPAKRGFCAVYAHQEASEEEDARDTAQFLKRDFCPVVVDEENFFAQVDDFLRAYEQPSADVAGLSLWCACKDIAAQSHLCLSGEGADEFFAGYDVYSPRSVRHQSLKPGFVYMGTTYIMNEAEQKRYLSQFYPEVSPRDFMRERTRPADGYDRVSQLLYADLKTYFEGSILFNSTKIAKGCGLDIRMPYCDLRLFEIACHVPSACKVNAEGNKRALRLAASRVLPREVAYRRKLGFPVPIRFWLEQPAAIQKIRRAFESETAKEFFNTHEINALLDAFSHEKPRVSHPVWFARHQALMWRHIWTIYLFIRWYELFFTQ